jgi:mycothiol synthase
VSDKPGTGGADRAARDVLPGLPNLPGLRARRYAGSDDLPGILRVANSAHKADGVDIVESLDELRAEFEHLVNEDPPRDMTIVERGGEIVAFARVSWAVRDGVYVYRSSGSVHPLVRRCGIGRALLRAAQARLREIAAGHPAEVEKRLTSELFDGEDGARALLEGDGYRPIRWFFEMARGVRDPIPDAPLPPGIEIRAVVERDHRAIFDAESEAFRDHWGYREWTDADFERIHATSDTDTSLWRVAWDGPDVAAVIETVVHPAENAGLGTNRAWLDRISTRRPWRGRGIAKALIASTVLGLRERGVDTAALGVDGDNPSGAFGLYESMGFSVVNGMAIVSRPLED